MWILITVICVGILLHVTYQVDVDVDNLNVWRIYVCFFFSFRSSIFGPYCDVTTDGEGLLNLDLCSAPHAFAEGDIYQYHARI